MKTDDDVEFDDSEAKKDNDIYDAEDLSEDDGVNSEESGFMRGYREAKDEEEL